MAGGYGDMGAWHGTYERQGGSSAEGDTRGARWTPYQASISTKLRQPGYSMAAFGGTPTVNSPGVGGQVYAKQANATARKVDSDALALHNHLMGSQGSAGPTAPPNPYEQNLFAQHNARQAPATPGSRIGVQAPMMASRPGVQAHAPAAPRSATAGDSDMAGISQQAQPFKPTPIGSPGQYAPQSTTTASGSTVAPFPDYTRPRRSPEEKSARDKFFASAGSSMSGQRAPSRPGVQGPLMAGRVGVQGGPQHSGIPDPVNGGYYSVAAAEAGRHGEREGRGHEFAQEVARGERAVSQQATLAAQGVQDHELGVRYKNSQIANLDAQTAQEKMSPRAKFVLERVKNGATPAQATAEYNETNRLDGGAEKVVTNPAAPATREALGLSHPEVAGMLGVDKDGAPASDPLAVLNMAKNSGIDFSNQSNPNVMALQRHFKTAYGDDKIAEMTQTPEPDLRTLPGLPEWVRMMANTHTLGILGTGMHSTQAEDMKGKQSLADQLSALMGQPAPAPYRPTYNDSFNPFSGAIGLYNTIVHIKHSTNH